MKCLSRWLWLPWTLCNRAALGRVMSANPLTCQFKIGQFEFDVCPAFGSRHFSLSIETDTPPTRTEHRYDMAFDGPLTKDNTLPDELQCPEGTRICLTVINTRPNHPSEPARILHVIPIVSDAGVDPKAKLADKVKSDDRHVSLHGGMYMRQTQKATFVFHCDPNSEEPSLPTFSWNFNGTHAFSWNTRYGCHKPISSTPPPNPEPDPDPPQDHPEDLDVDDNAHRPRESRFWRKLLISVSFITICFAFIRWLRHSPYIYQKWMSSISIVGRRMNAYRRLTSVPFSDMDGEEVPLTPSPTGKFANRARKHYGSF